MDIFCYLVCKDLTDSLICCKYNNETTIIEHRTMLANRTSGIFPVFCLLFSATLWGVIWYPLRLFQEQGLEGLWATLIMYVAASLFGIAISFKYRHEFWRYPVILLGIALANAWCNIAFILAVLEGSVVRVLLLFYLSPLWASLLGYIFLGERMSRQASITLVIAMIGAFIILWDPDLGAPWPRDKADWMAISSGFAFAISNVLVRKSQEISVEVKTMATWLGVAVLSAICIMLIDLPVPQIGSGVFIGVVLLGLLGVVSMTLAVQYGVTHMPVYRSAVILLFEIIAGAVSSLLLSDDVVHLYEWIGGGLVMLAAYLSARSHLNDKHV
jgi:drug/metabolite transporter (DMT)-like permease